MPMTRGSNPKHGQPSPPWHCENWSGRAAGTPSPSACAAGCEGGGGAAASDARREEAMIYVVTIIGIGATVVPFGMLIAGALLAARCVHTGRLPRWITKKDEAP